MLEDFRANVLKNLIHVVICQQAAIAWALGQIGRHTPEHAKAVAVTNALNSLLQCYLNTESSEDLQTKVTWKSNELKVHVV